LSSASETLRSDPTATYNPVLISNLTELLPQVNFPMYLSIFTPPSFPSKIILTHPSFFSNLSSIVAHADSDTVEAYLVSRAALQLAPLLSTETEAWKAVHTLHAKLDGIKKEGAVQDRAKFCVKSVESALGFALGRYFVQEKFSDWTGKRSAKILIGQRNFSLLNLGSLAH
jgi:endothelin-converting enzyme